MKVILCVLLGLIPSIVFNLYLKNKETEYYIDYEKKDSDPRWVLSHLFLVGLVIAAVIYIVIKQGLNGFTDYLALVCASFLIGIMGMELFNNHGRYIYYDKNHVYLNGTVIDRKSDCQVTKNSLLPQYKLKTTKSVLQVNKKQLLAINELLKENGKEIKLIK